MFVIYCRLLSKLARRRSSSAGGKAERMLPLHCEELLLLARQAGFAAIFCGVSIVMRSGAHLFVSGFIFGFTAV